MLQQKVLDTYKQIFGETNIKEEADELVNYYSEENLKEELGDLLSACFALAEEKGWNTAELIELNIEKVKQRFKDGHYSK